MISKWLLKLLGFDHVFLFWNGVSSVSSWSQTGRGWLWTPGPSSSASWALGSQVCATWQMSGEILFKLIFRVSLCWVPSIFSTHFSKWIHILDGLIWVWMENSTGWRQILKSHSKAISWGVCPMVSNLTRDIVYWMFSYRARLGGGTTRRIYYILYHIWEEGSPNSSNRHFLKCIL